MAKLIGCYLVVNEDGNEWIQVAGFGEHRWCEPGRWERGESVCSGFWDVEREGSCQLPNGTIEKLIGKKLTWADEPYFLDEFTKPTWIGGGKQLWQRKNVNG
jgi:hypothetical protein